jgi:hypothetical protein
LLNPINKLFVLHAPSLASSRVARPPLVPGLLRRETETDSRYASSVTRFGTYESEEYPSLA